MLSSPAKVKISVYNVLGIKITTLLDEYKTSGNYELQWNAEDKPSGVYYVHLEVNSRLKTQKMVLLK